MPGIATRKGRVTATIGRLEDKESAIPLNGALLTLLPSKNRIPTTQWLAGLSRTNLVGLVPDSIAGPYADTYGTKIVENATNGIHSLTFIPTIRSGDTYTFSAFVKAAGTRHVRLADTGLSVAVAIFDLTNGVVFNTLGSASPTASITSMGNGWYAVSMTFTSNTASANFGIYIGSTTATFSYAGDLTSGLYIYAPQFERGTARTVYQRGSTNTQFARNVASRPAGTFVNVVSQSSRLDLANWVASSASKTAAAGTDPNGTSNAARLTEGIAGDGSVVHTLSQTLPAYPSGYLSPSVYVKQETVTRRIQLSLIEQSGIVLASAVFDFQTGAVISNTNCTGSIASAGSGWWRCSLSGLYMPYGTGIFRIHMVTGSTTTTTYVGNGTNTCLLWGAHMEYVVDAASYAGTYSEANNIASQAAANTVPGPASPNMLLRSGMVNTTTWVKTNLTGTTGSANGPHGETDIIKQAVLLTNNGTNGAHTAVQTLSTALNAPYSQVYSASIYAKAGTTQWLGFQVANGLQTVYSTFDLTNGVVGATNSGSTSGLNYASMKSIGSGWYLCTLTYTTPTTGTASAHIVTVYVQESDSIANYAGTTKTLSVQNVQLSAGTVFVPDDFTGTGTQPSTWNIGGNLAPAVQLGSTNGVDANDPATHPALYVFDGVDDILLSGAPRCTGNNNYTMWAVVSGAAQTTKGIYVEGSSTDAAKYAGITTGSSDNTKWRYAVVGAGTEVTAESMRTVFGDSLFHFIAVTDANGTYKMFTDGVQGTFGGYSRTAKTFDQAAIGAIATSTMSGFFAGDVAAVGSFNWAMSNLEIDWLYRAVKAYMASVGITIV